MKFYKLVTHSLFRKSRKFHYIITYIGRYILSLSPVAYGVPQGSVDRTDPFPALRRRPVEADQTSLAVPSRLRRRQSNLRLVSAE